MSTQLPVIFFGHGNPMHAIRNNDYTEKWRQIGQNIPKPKAIICISAHWYIPRTSVTVSASPKTIHDFGGFPKELFEVEYPAPGDPDLAQRVKDLLLPIDVNLDDRWGLDHGTWSVLKHVYPEADIPVIQLSIDESKPALFHYGIGKKLAPLRQEGVLIIGSGNIIHNLHAYAWGRHMPQPYDWAERFEKFTKEKILNGEYEELIRYESLGSDARLSIPTPEHYLPLLYVLGAANKQEKVSFPLQGIDGGSISMLTLQIG